MSELPERRLANYLDFAFDGDQLVAIILEHDGVAVPTRSVSLALGLDPENQSRRLREHAVLSHGLRVVLIPHEGKLRPMLAILHKYIPFWLATITPGQVSAAVRPKLVRYQIELVDLLAALYGNELRRTQPPTGDAVLDALQQRLDDALMEVRLAR